MLLKLKTFLAMAALSADFSGGYNWGTYRALGQPDDAQGGMALQLVAGGRWRLVDDLSTTGGLVGQFGFPQITVPIGGGDASFHSRAFGFQAGALWRGRFEAIFQYFPFATLSQTTPSRLGTATVETRFGYQGSAYGAGAKLYFTRRESREAQVGLKFLYTRERYNSSTVESSIAPLADHATPGFTPSRLQKSGDELASGDSYQMAVFIGI